jgi:hypothetical protein
MLHPALLDWADGTPVYLPLMFVYAVGNVDLLR